MRRLSDETQILNPLVVIARLDRQPRIEFGALSEISTKKIGQRVRGIWLLGAYSAYA